MKFSTMTLRAKGDFLRTVGKWHAMYSGMAQEQLPAVQPASYIYLETVLFCFSFVLVFLLMG